MASASIVYALCAITSLLCAYLLFRAFCNSKTSVLLWSSVCFIGLAANNVLLFVDLVIVPGPDINLSGVRSVVAFASVAVMLFGLIWDPV